jgi:hypothetical protein
MEFSWRRKSPVEGWVHSRAGLNSGELHPFREPCATETMGTMRLLLSVCTQAAVTDRAVSVVLNN